MSFLKKIKDIPIGIDTLYLKATCDDDAKTIALETLELLAEKYMNIGNVSVIDIKRAASGSNNRYDYEVKVMYECNFKVKNEDDKRLRFYTLKDKSKN